MGGSRDAYGGVARIGRDAGARRFLAGHAANLARAALGAAGRLAPYWSDGIVVWARPAA